MTGGLRGWALVACGILAVTALVAGGLFIFPPAWPVALVFGGAGLFLFVERVQYKAIEAKRPGSEWTETGERFVDPASGAWVQVFYNPRTGERAYVAAESERDAKPK